jgi:hypothetical protein
VQPARLAHSKQGFCDRLRAAASDRFDLRREQLCRQIDLGSGRLLADPVVAEDDDPRMRPNQPVSDASGAL